MKRVKYLILSILMLSGTLFAETFMTVSGDPLDASNWSNGLPNINNDGTIGIDIVATCSDGNIGSAFAGTGGTGGMVSILTIDGGTLTKTGSGNLIIGSNTRLVLNSGIVENQGGDIRFNRASAVVNGGSFYTSGSIVLFGTQSDVSTQGQFLMTGGSVDVNSFIMNQSGVPKQLVMEGGTLNISGRLDMAMTPDQCLIFSGNGKRGDVTIGATGIVYGDSFVNFESGSLGSLTIVGYDESQFKEDYTNGNILFDGLNTAVFEEIFSVSGETLSLVPEPALSAIGMCLLCALLLIHKIRRSRD